MVIANAMQYYLTMSCSTIKAATSPAVGVLYVRGSCPVTVGSKMCREPWCNVAIDFECKEGLPKEDHHITYLLLKGICAMLQGAIDFECKEELP